MREAEGLGVVRPRTGVVERVQVLRRGAALWATEEGGAVAKERLGALVVSRLVVSKHGALRRQALECVPEEDRERVPVVRVGTLDRLRTSGREASPGRGLGSESGSLQTHFVRTLARRRRCRTGSWRSETTRPG
jgi:hypothetical protein